MSAPLLNVHTAATHWGDMFVRHIGYYPSVHVPSKEERLQQARGLMPKDQNDFAVSAVCKQTLQNPENKPFKK